jgi:hypothetical protein
MASSKKRAATSKKRPAKKRADFATAAEYKRYKKRSDTQKKAWKEKVERKLAAQRYLAVNLPKMPIRGLAETDGQFLKRYQDYNQSVLNYIEGERETQDFVDALDVHMLRKNFAIAIEPSRLRHLNESEEMEEMLKRAAKKGERALRKQCKAFAEWFAVPIREVYTLFFSP